jgi:hypothetical protein
MALAVVVASVCKDPSSAECDVSYYHIYIIIYINSVVCRIRMSDL